MASVADDVETTETTPLTGQSSPGCPNFLTCKVSGFCGCTTLGQAMMIVIGIDVVAFALLVASGALCLAEGSKNTFTNYLMTKRLNQN